MSNTIQATTAAVTANPEISDALAADAALAAHSSGSSSSTSSSSSASSGQVKYQDYSDSQVRVVSDAPISAAQAKALAGRIEKAYGRDEKVEQWKDTGPLDAQLTVAVLSQNAFANFTGDTTGSVAGVTTGPNVFVVPSRVLGTVDAQDQDTIAHELDHVQDFREGGDSVSNGQVPIYLQEGKAYVLGDSYPANNDEQLNSVAGALGQLSSSDAAYVLKNFRKPDDEQKDPNFVFYGEVTGALFVEFLRTKLGGTGKSDAIPRLAEATAEAGDGKSYASAFQGQFGLSLPNAEKQFLAYMKNTEGDPTARLAGTIYAGRG